MKSIPAQLHPFDQSIALVLTTACIRLGQWAAETQQAETGQERTLATRHKSRIESSSPLLITGMLDQVINEGPCLGW